MSNAIKLTDIEWAYTIKLDSNTSLANGFIKNLSLFVGEIIRSDEIGLLIRVKRYIKKGENMLEID